MNYPTQTTTDWMTTLHRLGPDFAERAAANDRSGRFVFENYEQLKEHRFFSAMIPETLGGGGLAHSDMCRLIHDLAGYCPSTALAFSMHQHLIAAAVWKYQQQGVGAEMLQKVSENQWVLVSTGARDWLQSNGEMTKTKGGYRVTAKKYFASQSVAGDLAITSAPFQGENGDWKVLHFSVPLNAEGVSVLDDWDVLGMRATGSQALVFDQVFVPEDAVALERPREGFHPIWSVVLTVALPLILSAYVGIAEQAAKIALQKGKKDPHRRDHLPYLIGKLHNARLSARAQWQMMYTLTNELDFQPEEATAIDMLSYKTNVAEAAIQTVTLATEAAGGQSFYRKAALERLFRDVQAARFHPLPQWEQFGFTGKRLLDRLNSYPIFMKTHAIRQYCFFPYAFLSVGSGKPCHFRLPNQAHFRTGCG